MRVTEKKLEIVTAFLNRLGDPKEYHFTGQIHDLGLPVGVCVCGHQIRYEYLISNGKKRVAVGSECIHNFSEYNESLYNELIKAHEEFKASQAEEKRLAKEAQENEQVSKLAEEYSNLRSAAKAMFPNRLPYLPYELYSAFQSVNKVPTYKRTTSYIKWYTKTNKEYKELLKALAPYVQLPTPVKEVVEEPATEKQIAFLRILLKKEGTTKSEEWFSSLSKKTASSEISIRVRY